MADGDELVDLVEDLLAMPFSRQTFTENLDLVRRGQPTPTLASLLEQRKGFFRHSHASNYECYPWLTGSEKCRKLYCWDCLLLANDCYGVWSHTEFAILGCLSKKQQNSKARLHA